MTAEEYVVEELKSLKEDNCKLETECCEWKYKFEGLHKKYRDMYDFFYNRLNLENWNDGTGYIIFNSIWHFDESEVEYIKNLFKLESFENEGENNG